MDLFSSLFFQSVESDFLQDALNEDESQIHLRTASFNSHLDFKTQRKYIHQFFLHCFFHFIHIATINLAYYMPLFQVTSFLKSFTFCLPDFCSSSALKYLDKFCELVLANHSFFPILLAR